MVVATVHDKMNDDGDAADDDWQNWLYTKNQKNYEISISF